MRSPADGDCSRRWLNLLTRLLQWSVDFAIAKEDCRLEGKRRSDFLENHVVISSTLTGRGVLFLIKVFKEGVLCLKIKHC